MNTEEAIAKDELKSLNESTFSDIKESYFGVVDNLKPLIEALERGACEAIEAGVSDEDSSVLLAAHLELSASYDSIQSSLRKLRSL